MCLPSRDCGLAPERWSLVCSVPRSQRGGEIIEPIVSEQWFVKMEPLAKPALAAVANGDIAIVPPRFAKVYNHWLEDIQDWCISRQLWWGHRIPVWYCFADAAAAEASLEGRCDQWVVARNEGEALAQVRRRARACCFLACAALARA